MRKRLQPCRSQPRRCHADTLQNETNQRYVSGKATTRNKCSDPTFKFLRRGAEKIPRPRAWCAYFEHAPFPNGRLPGGLAADLIHNLLACRIPSGREKCREFGAKSIHAPQTLQIR